MDSGSTCGRLGGCAGCLSHVRQCDSVSDLPHWLASSLHDAARTQVALDRISRWQRRPAAMEASSLVRSDGTRT
jgi:hypothetical protein